MTYPTRGAWRFRNVTKAADFWPTLDSIGIQAEHPSGLATLAGSVVDPDLSQTFEPEDRVWATFTPYGGSIRRIFNGHIKTVTERMLSEVGPRVWDFDAQDCTAKLDDSVIDSPGTRASESNADRVDWILSFLNFGITTANLSPPAGTAEEADFDGQTVREALDQFCEEADAHYYLDFGPDDPDDGNVPDLHLFANETLSAPFDLDDLTPDFSTTFPFTEYARSRDSGDLTTAVYVQGETGIAWVTDPALIATYGRQERTLADSNLKTANAMAKAAAQMLVKDGTPVLEGSLVCWEPGLMAGMKPLLSVDLWSLSEVPVFLTSVSITAVDPHDADGVAFLRSEVTFTDRRRLKGRGRRPPKAAPPDTSGTDDADKADDAALDFWPGMEGRERAGWSDPAENSWAEPSVVGAPKVGSWIAENTSWPGTDCGLGPGIWGPGGITAEAWWPVTIPAGIAGVYVTFPDFSGTAQGVAIGGTYLVGWAIDVTPGGLNGWTEVGAITDTGGTVFVPGSLMVESSGGSGITADNWLVLAPGWGHSAGFTGCGNDMAYPYNGPVKGGEAGSGNVVPPNYNDLSGTTLVNVGPGKTSWVSPVGGGVADGANDTWTLADWNGLGIPEARWGAVIMSYLTDYDIDAGAGTVTFKEPPREGTVVAFRYRVDA